MDLHPKIEKFHKISLILCIQFLRKVDNWSCSRANPVIVHSLDMKKSLFQEIKKIVLK